MLVAAERLDARISRDLDDLTAACEEIRRLAQAIDREPVSLVTALGKAWLLRAHGRLEQRADHWVRGGRALPSSEQAALSLIHEMAAELRQASIALDLAAQHLVGFRASQAKQASTRALKAAEGLVRA